MIFAKMFILKQNPFQNRFFCENYSISWISEQFSERMLLYWHSPNVGLECCVNGPFKYSLKNNQYVESKQQKAAEARHSIIFGFIHTFWWCTGLHSGKDTILWFLAPVLVSYKLYFVKTYTENKKLMNFHWF